MFSVDFFRKSFVALSVLGLAACGGGSGGSSDSGNSATSPDTAVTSSDNAPVVANPIGDESAKVGENYHFDIPADTCTDADGDAITYSITRMSNGSGLSLVNFNSIQGTPTRPGIASVTVTCSAGSASATDEFIITITEDNIAPTVDAGDEQTVTAGDTVTLTAVAADANTDGSIASYLWQQMSGDINVETITDSDQAVASFIAPDVDNTQTLTFTVQVTDNLGATSSDTVDITVLSKNMPEVAVDFPLPYAEITASEIDVFGNVTTKNGATLASVTLSANETSYDAVIDEEGNAWRVADVSLTDVESITVTATDSKGLTGSSVLPISASSSSEIDIDNNIVDMSLDTANNRMYVQVTGLVVSDIKTYAIDLTDGTQSTVAATDTEDTFSNAQRFSIAFDKTSNQLVTGVNNGVTSAVLVTDIATLERSVLSSDVIGSGPSFGLITDIIFDDQGLAYLIDNTNNQVLSLDLTTGNRTLVADGSASPQAISFPLSGIFNPGNDSLIVATNSFFGSPLQTVDTTVVNSVAEIEGTTTYTVNDLAIDNANQVIYFVDEDNNLTSYDLTSETTSVLIENFLNVTSIVTSTVSSVGLEFDDESKLLYIVGDSLDTRVNTVFVYDVVSGDYIKL
ncbi:PKD domain-containing protein [Thalassomonas haliotis]|uniref:Dystroglycan-type cadherin-like domain-containing protein n=1 Tax=Thalassomonas haliotis TaxID=485448 RepID=A0ABY7VBK4_9GAMM|nr:putative Ig domain-containing protein [Thalassomonas haliotis]WDE11029.1 hypothetical protein H3N35_22765 [Thalassomonas haliotis]